MARRSRALTSSSRIRFFLQSGAPLEDSEKAKRRVYSVLEAVHLHLRSLPPLSSYTPSQPPAGPESEPQGCSLP